METTDLKDTDERHREYKRRKGWQATVARHSDLFKRSCPVWRHVETDAQERRKVAKQPMQELPSSSDLALYGEVRMNSGMIFKSDTGKYAWDDVNNMERPTREVQEARKEEMTHMKTRL